MLDKFPVCFSSAGGGWLVACVVEPVTDVKWSLYRVSSSLSLSQPPSLSVLLAFTILVSASISFLLENDCLKLGLM